MDFSNLEERSDANYLVTIGPADMLIMGPKVETKDNKSRLVLYGSAQEREEKKGHNLGLEYISSIPDMWFVPFVRRTLSRTMGGVRASALRTIFGGLELEMLVGLSPRPKTFSFSNEEFAALKQGIDLWYGCQAADETVEDLF